MTAELHNGIPMDVYLNLPAVSAGLLKTTVSQCPLAAWQQSWLNKDKSPDDTKASDLGTIIHSLVLEGDDSGIELIQPDDYASGNGNVPKGWTNNAIRAARDAARASGKIPVLPDDMIKANAVTDAVRAYIDTLKQTEPAIWEAMQPGNAVESVVTWVDPIGATPCKIRPDVLKNDHSLIVDLKTTATSANPASWSRTQMTGQSSYVSSAFYRRGIHMLSGKRPDYVFLVVEVEPPYLCSLIGTDPRAFELGTEKVEAGLQVWSRCVERQQWPAYPNRVCYPELPVFVDYAWQEEQHGIAYSMDKLRGVKTV